jgi:4-methyl-5(b-hydroxyethyl)-thiazole monophosphate biosynthesis
MRIGVIITNNSEDIETVVPIDLWRRAQIQIDTISITNDLKINLANSITIIANYLLNDVDLNKYDGFYFPGGKGVFTINYEDCKKLIDHIKNNIDHLIILAICAAPGKLADLGILTNEKATGYPQTCDGIKNFINQKIVYDKNFLTADGPGTTIEFALAAIKYFINETKYQQIANEILYGKK